MWERTPSLIVGLVLLCFPVPPTILTMQSTRDAVPLPVYPSQITVRMMCNLYRPPGGVVDIFDWTEWCPSTLFPTKLTTICQTLNTSTMTIQFGILRMVGVEILDVVIVHWLVHNVLFNCRILIEIHTKVYSSRFSF